MKKVIVVKHNSLQKLGFYIIATLLFIVAAVCLLYSKSVLLALLLLIVYSPLVFVILHYERWRVSFDDAKITIREFGHSKTYSYYQITDAYTAHSYTLHDHICLVFFDGKKLIIRSDDENSDYARRKIQSHRSIRRAKW